MNKENFKQYCIKTTKNERTNYMYINSFESDLYKLENKELHNIKIFEINSVNEFSKVKKKIENDKNFIFSKVLEPDKYKNSANYLNGRLKSGLNKYMDFLLQDSTVLEKEIISRKISLFGKDAILQALSKRALPCKAIEIYKDVSFILGLTQIEMDIKSSAANGNRPLLNHRLNTYLKKMSENGILIRTGEKRSFLYSINKQKEIDLLKIYSNLDNIPYKPIKSIEELKNNVNHLKDVTPIKREVVTYVRVRSKDVKYITEERASGICELCKKEAPFKDSNNKPFLEVHHVVPLSEGGDDHYTNTVALCPNCHREVHNGNNKDKLTKLLKNYLHKYV